MYLNGYSFSDGTLRFIALATLLLQSKTPEVIVIDEPELGLHPAAINKFAELVKRASNKSQIILSTQSTNLVNCFDVRDIIVVDRIESQSVFRHLSEEDLATWMDEYDLSISDLWEKNMIGGQLRDVNILLWKDKLSRNSSILLFLFIYKKLAYSILLRF